MRKLLMILPLFIMTTLHGESPLVRYPKYREYYVAGSVTVEDHYNAMISLMEQKRYRKALCECNTILDQYPNSPFAAEAAYSRGVIYFAATEYEKANVAFSAYLANYSNLKYFYEAIAYKFKIAEQFFAGIKKRVFGAEKMPRLVSSRNDALALYDEVISALPRDEMCARSLYKKGLLMKDSEEYKDAIDIFQIVIRRFPTHPLAAQAYLAISKIFLQEATKLFPDPDFIELANINLEKFEAAFPSDLKVLEAKENLQKMKDVFAKELLEMASYFYKKKKWDAANVYYKTILTYYPDSKSAKEMQDKMPRKQ
ncbi:MAG: tetratricopeptide repeat protein [Chlamydiales bacterium]|nr:tetratricopeptide repeat protein [Chlamydiales bacterium]